MRRRSQCVAAMMLLLIAAGGSMISAQESGWSSRFNLTWTDPSRTFVNVEADGTRVKTATAEAFGLALSGEYRFSDRLGLEIGVQAGYEADVTLDVSNAVTGETSDGLTLPVDGLRFTLLDASLNIYLSSGKVDLYIGPVIGYMVYDDLSFRMGAPSVTVDVQVDGDLALGGVLGMDVPCGDSGWFFTTSLKYLDTSYDAQPRGEATGKQEIDFDPFIARAGFGYRY